MNKLNLINNSIISCPDYKKFENILTDTSISSKDFINPINYFLPTKEKTNDFNTRLFIDSLFSTKRIIIPYFNIFDNEINKFTRFEDFTMTNEVGNITLWLLSALRYLSSTNIRLGRELEINQSGNPRDGRLDVVAVKNNMALVIETKTDLRSLLNENRFTYQISGYVKECNEYMMREFQSSDLTILLAIGGDESDIFPPNHRDCTTGVVGGISRIFYDKIISNKIKFISANSIWALVTYKYLTKSDIDLFDLLRIIFSKENAIGLLTGGVVVNENGELKIEKIDLEKN